MGKGELGALAAAFVAWAVLSGCGSSDAAAGNPVAAGASAGGAQNAGAGANSAGATSAGAPSSPGGATAAAGATNPDAGPPAGYPDGHAAVPALGQAEDTSSPTTIIGSGDPMGCTGASWLYSMTMRALLRTDSSSADQQRWQLFRRAV